MDLQWYSSIIGIAGVTVALSQAAKKGLTNVPYLQKVPLWLYAFLFSLAGTWFANNVLHTLEGELIRNMTDAATATLFAIGGFETVSNLLKPVEASGTSDNQNRNMVGLKKTGSLLILAVMAGSLTAACATANKNVVLIDDQVHDHLTEANNQLTNFCPPPSDAQSALAQPCQDVRIVLRESMALARDFNTAAQQRRVDLLPQLITQFGKLQEVIGNSFESVQRDQLTQIIGAAIQAAYQGVKQ